MILPTSRLEKKRQGKYFFFYSVVPPELAIITITGVSVPSFAQINQIFLHMVNCTTCGPVSISLAQNCPNNFLQSPISRYPIWQPIRYPYLSFPHCFMNAKVCKKRSYGQVLHSGRRATCTHHFARLFIRYDRLSHIFCRTGTYRL